MKYKLLKGKNGRRWKMPEAYIGILKTRKEFAAMPELPENEDLPEIQPEPEAILRGPSPEAVKYYFQEKHYFELERGEEQLSPDDPEEASTPFWQDAVSFNETASVVKWILSQVHDLNQIDPKNQCSAVENALWNPNLEILKLLLETGADPNIPDAFGKTPIDNATDEDQVTLLLKFRATSGRFQELECVAF